MIVCVEVSTQPGLRDARGESVRRHIEALGIHGVQAVSTTDLYFLQGTLADSQVNALVNTLLCDPIVEQARWLRIETLERESLPAGIRSVEVTLLPGVTDSVAESLLAGARLIGLASRSGAADYNQKLSVRRAKNVDASLSLLLFATDLVNPPGPPPRTSVGGQGEHFAAGVGAKDGTEESRFRSVLVTILADRTKNTPVKLLPA